MATKNSKYADVFSGKFPPKEFEFHDKDTTENQYQHLIELVEGNSGEKELDKFITQNPEVLTPLLAVFGTGNHTGWVFSKPQIATNILSKGNRGLIPDFILGGQSSDGQEWWVVELKGANEQIFKEDKNKKIGFSNVANQGVFQLLEYIDYCSEKQMTFRDFGLKNFREPNGLLLIGRENEFDEERKRSLKSAWNKLHSKKLEIRTYDSLIRAFKSALARQADFSSREKYVQPPFDEEYGPPIG